MFGREGAFEVAPPRSSGAVPASRLASWKGLMGVGGKEASCPRGAAPRELESPKAIDEGRLPKGELKLRRGEARLEVGEAVGRNASKLFS